MNRHIFRKELDLVFKTKYASFNEMDKALFRILKKYENDPFILNTHYPIYNSEETVLLKSIDCDLTQSTLFLINNPQININVAMSNMNVLMFACVRNEAYVKALLNRHDLDPNYEAQNHNALLFAINYSSANVVKMLLNSKLNFEIKTEENKSLIHTACYNTNQLKMNTSLEEMIENKYELIELLMPYDKNPLMNMDNENALECLLTNEFDADKSRIVPQQIALINQMITFYNIDLNIIEQAYQNTSKHEKLDCKDFIETYIHSTKEKAKLEKNMCDEPSLNKKSIKL